MYSTREMVKLLETRGINRQFEWHGSNARHYVQMLYHIATSPFTFKIEKFILLNCSNEPNQQRSIKSLSICVKQKKASN
jgi:hypothetical protein